MRFINNTKYKTIDPIDLIQDVRHLFQHVETKNIESIVLDDTSVRVYGVECVLFECATNKPLKKSGVIRWFDSVSGEGVVRLDDGPSIFFFACNVVGADSCYPQLVKNVSFEAGEKVTCEISNDPYMYRALGLTNVEKAV